MLHAWHAGMDYATPMSQTIRANGEKAWFGWPNIPPVEVTIAAWFEAKTLEEEKAAARALNKAALTDVIYAPLGFFLSYQAWRTNVTGIIKGPLPFFWGVSKAA
jgi:peptide/nickel transport system substrate-binding protein